MVTNLLWSCAFLPNLKRDRSTGEQDLGDVKPVSVDTQGVGSEKKFSVVPGSKRVFLKEEKDPETSGYFTEILRGFGELGQLQLVQSDGTLRYPTFRAFSFDSAAIVVSRSSYETLRYESELAGLLAWEVARRKAGVYQIGLTAIDREVQFGRDAVNLMYRSGFDPRGLVAFLERYQNNKSLGQGEVPPQQVELLLAGVRSELAALPPLSNPINRSQRFIELRQKWESKRSKKN